MLEAFDIYAVLPATNLATETAFLRDVLGLSAEEEGDGAAIYRSGTNSRIQVYETPNAGTAQNTAMGWMVTDLEGVMAQLRDRGVVFEEYDFPGLKTENGIATSPVDRAAWFRDPSGNILCISERL